MEIEPLVDLIKKLKVLGINEFTLADTIDKAHPQQIINVLNTVKETFPRDIFNLHIHDTYNMGILNTYIGIKCGVNSIQSFLGGLGGCPFAPGASGK